MRYEILPQVSGDARPGAAAAHGSGYRGRPNVSYREAPQLLRTPYNNSCKDILLNKPADAELTFAAVRISAQL